MNHELCKQVLVVDDEASMRAALQASFSHQGWHVETAQGVTDAMTRFRRYRPALVVTDMRMPDGDGFAVMRRVQELAPRTAVILLTAFGSVPDAVTAMQGGACDYLVNPVAFERLEQSAQSVLDRAQSLSARRSLRDPVGDHFVGYSAALQRALQQAQQAAASDADILLEAPKVELAKSCWLA